MEILNIFIFFIFGTLFGSFLTVVGQRLPKGEKFIISRSHCDTCQHELKLFEMIPFFSFVFLRGRCRYCHNKINTISTYMELFLGILFALSYYLFGYSYNLFIALGISTMLVLISVSDITYLVIPDEILVIYSLYFIIVNLVFMGISYSITQILYGLFLFLVMYIIMLLGNLFLKKESLGGGDIKMMFVFGLILDPLLGALSIFIASVIALPISLFILYKTKNNLIPFGPFLLTSLTFIYYTSIKSNDIIAFLLSI